MDNKNYEFYKNVENSAQQSYRKLKEKTEKKCFFSKNIKKHSIF